MVNLPARDKEGFLLNTAEWSESVALALALEQNISLNDAQMELIHCTRDFYQRFSLSPAMRPLVKFVAQELGPEKGNSIYLMQQFPDTTARTLCRLAGLPKPTNCL